MKTMRAAIYYTPAAEQPLARSAASWLGRDAFSGAEVPRSAPDGLDAETLVALTEAPRRYGFHATLKAPFRLRDGTGLDEIEAALAAFSSATPAVIVPSLALARLGDFHALVPAERAPGPDGLAAAVVEHFEPFRAPLSEAELARRLRARLTPRQDSYLERWGYPYVFDEFRFHMSLTGPVPADMAPAVGRALTHAFGAFVGRPLLIDALTLFVEPQPGTAFSVRSRHPLRGPTDRSP